MKPLRRLDELGVLRQISPLLHWNDWLEERVHYYREMGFFQQHPGVGDRELAGRLRAVHRGADDPRLVPDDPAVDLWLLAHDPERVWRAAVRGTIITK